MRYTYKALSNLLDTVIILLLALGEFNIKFRGSGFLWRKLSIMVGSGEDITWASSQVKASENSVSVFQSRCVLPNVLGCEGVGGKQCKSPHLQGLTVRPSRSKVSCLGP